VKKAKTTKAPAPKKKTILAKPKTVAKPQAAAKPAKKPVKKTAKKAVQKMLTVKPKQPSKKITKKVSTVAKVSSPSPKRPKKSEVLIGTVTHYYAQIGVAVVRLDAKSLSVGDTMHVNGHTTDFTQTVDSMEMDHQPIRQAHAEDDFGMKVVQHVRVGDAVYKVNG
jgi:putative protease